LDCPVPTIWLDYLQENQRQVYHVIKFQFSKKKCDQVSNTLGNVIILYLT
jgi:hypothetical protein